MRCSLALLAFSVHAAQRTYRTRRSSNKRLPRTVLPQCLVNLRRAQSLSLSTQGARLLARESRSRQSVQASAGGTHISLNECFSLLGECAGLVGHNLMCSALYSTKVSQRIGCTAAGNARSTAHTEPDWRPAELVRCKSALQWQLSRHIPWVPSEFWSQKCPGRGRTAKKKNSQSSQNITIFGIPSCAGLLAT